MRRQLDLPPAAGRGALLVTAVAAVTALAACAPTVGDVFPEVPGALERFAALPPPAPLAPAAPAEPECTPAPLERRAAAVLVVGIPGARTAEDPLAQQVVDLGVGGVFLSESNLGSPGQVRALTAGMRERAARPLLVATDEESGRVSTTRALTGGGPSPRRLAQTRTPEEVRAQAAELGARLHDLGVDLDLAPLLDLDDGPADGVVGDRSFSGDPATAAAYGLAFSAGLADAGVVPTVKHFPGHGASSTDTHTDDAVVDASLDELAARDLVPFVQAVDAGVPVVMLNHVQYAALDPGVPASLSPRAYDLLRDLGFEGVAITDSLGMGAVNLRWDFPEAAVLAVTAGADAVLTTDGRHAVRMRDALVAAVASGTLPEARLSEAAARVTALAGGDPVAMSCLDVDVPSGHPRAPLGSA
ncbi:glycoside hydrolase family 3 N-terminal domain-containing protein [Actinotalea solisilvae]|uniref:glycoside hydrolase family 3 N-terminal domain-containing protein n=1 Tax=Actinotalea solisilvae TaxID=2072922 RepID=UPI0018F1B577|nr:glycoside hydrolase family 3 N-terminal domain-containing protein [Actinotalea solisilvae]